MLSMTFHHFRVVLSIEVVHGVLMMGQGLLVTNHGRFVLFQFCLVGTEMTAEFGE